MFYAIPTQNYDFISVQMQFVVFIVLEAFTCRIGLASYPIQHKVVLTTPEASSIKPSRIPDFRSGNTYFSSKGLIHGAVFQIKWFRHQW